MLVYAVRLRSRGQKLATVEVQLAQPVRGWLTLQPGRDVRSNEECLSAWITETQDTLSKNLLPPMQPALVKRAAGFQMIILGKERIDKGRKNCDFYPQAWWCRLPGLHR